MARAANSVPRNVPEGPPPSRQRNILIAAGVIISLAMFLWDRRRKD
jgi:hypothetical protein